MSLAKLEGVQRFAVAGIIIKEGRILMVQRAADDFMGGFWELPGGHLEEGEDIFEALIRELVEETSLVVTEMMEYCPAFDYISDRGGLTRQLNFIVHVQNIGDLNLSAEHSDFLWLSKHDYCNGSNTDLPKFSPEMEKCLDSALQSVYFNSL
jgi:8-oxo-dGTP diphosphatase